jgi:tripartite-type tricarboxylate transporter receptor subunit TctC
MLAISGEAGERCSSRSSRNLREEKMRLTRMLGSLALAAAMVAPAVAQDNYPERLITLVLPRGAGGSHDLQARGITGVISDILGQPMVVKLVPGGAGMKGSKEVADADPDGYTIIFTHNGFDQIVPQTRDAGFDPLTAFTAIAKINQAEPILCSPADEPFDTLEEFVAYAKEHPGEINLGHSGNWGAGHIPAMQLINASEIEVNLIPHQGGGPTLQALLSGEDDIGTLFTTQARAHVKAGTIKCLAVAGDKPIADDEDFSDLPTMASLGYPNVSFTMERIFMAPAGIPEDRLEKLRSAFAELMENKSFQRFINSIGEKIDFQGGDEYDEKRPARLEEYKMLIDKVGGGGT